VSGFEKAKLKLKLSRQVNVSNVMIVACS
jgi:hypothetical protein